MEPPEPATGWRVLAVRIGTRSTERSDVYLNYGLYGEPDGPATVDYFFWIVQNDESTIVVDTGFSEEAGRKRGRTLLLHPADALASLGIDPDQVRDVVVTHGHYDHIGNLGLFPHARVHMAESEYSFWTSPAARHTQFSYYSEEREIGYLRACASEGRLHLFTGSTSIAPGIRAEEVGGHTPGQAVVRIAAGDRDVLLASDAVHFYEELERDMPFTAVSDLPAMYAVFASIRSRSGNGELIVVPGHDPDVLVRFPACSQLPAGCCAVITTSASS